MGIENGVVTILLPDDAVSDYRLVLNPEEAEKGESWPNRAGSCPWKQ